MFEILKIDWFLLCFFVIFSVFFAFLVYHIHPKKLIQSSDLDLEGIFLVFSCIVPHYLRLQEPFFVYTDEFFWKSIFLTIPCMIGVYCSFVFLGSYLFEESIQLRIFYQSVVVYIFKRWVI